MERRIREIREDYALSKIPTRAFEANALYLEVVRLAYNLTRLRLRPTSHVSVD
jgi:hypothetical protein